MPRLPFFRKGSDGASRNSVERIPFLALLEPELRRRVRKRLARRRVESGKALFRQGEEADALYLIESGRFRTFVSERAGRERVLQFLGPGEILGEAAFIAETPYVTSAVAVEKAVVWRLSRTEFDALLAGHDALLRYLARLISERQASANARLAADSAPEEKRALRGYVSAVFSPRGGAGVTTIALNLAVALAERHPDDVVLLDLDVQFGHALTNLWLEARGVLAQSTPAMLNALDRGGLDRYLLRHASSLRIFPAATRPEEGQTITGEHVRAAITTLKRHFGHVILDLPHSFNDVALSGLDLSDRILVVATPETVMLKDIRETRRIFHDVLLMPPERSCFVLNHPQPYSAVSLQQFTATTETPWLEVGHGGEAPTASALRGESLVDTRRNNPVVRATAGLAEQISKEAREHAALAGRQP